MELEIRYPLITKKTSTPIKPPLNKEISKWKSKTERTASPLVPFIVELNLLILVIEELIC